jgi:PAS domain S-box-containing protein
MPSQIAGEQTISKVKKELEEYKSKFQELFELSKDGVCILEDGDIVSANNSFSSMIEYESSTLLNTSFKDYVDPLEIRYHPEKLEVLFSEKTCVSPMYLTLITKNKKKVISEICVKEIIHDNFNSKIIIVRDITELTKLRDSTNKFKDRFNTFIQTSPEAHFILTPQGTIKDANLAASKLLLYELDELKEKEIIDLIPDNNPMHRMCMQVVRETLLRKQITDAEIQLVRKDGSLVWVSISTFRIGEKSDRYSLIDFIAKDIDRRKKAEQHAKEVKERADLYLEVLTHDMTNVTQNSELTFELLRSSLDIPKDLELIVDEACWDLRRGSRMIANMRALVKLEETQLERRGFELRQCLERIGIEVTKDFPHKILNLNIDISDIVYEVEGHNLLKVVFYNILHNAMTYNNRNSVDVRVVVSKVDGGQMIKIGFLDNGPGIPDELKEHIFKRTGSPTKQIVGRGLGLTLADRVVKDLDGEIWVENKVKGNSKQGSKFIVILPSWCEEERPWGEEPPIVFYKSSHCVFCEPMLEKLTAILHEMSISFDAVKVVNVDDPEAGINEDELITLPTIEMGSMTLIGLVDENEIRSNLMNLMMTW